MTSLLLFASAADARKPALPRGELVLPMDAPVIEVAVAGVPLRLRVGLEAKDLVEINPDTVARLPIRFEDGFAAEVGRETLKGITAAAVVRIGGISRMAQISSHGRPCCAGVDGEIGVGLLPYATLRLVRAGMSGSVTARNFTTRSTPERGLELLGTGDGVVAQLAPTRERSVATAAAGAILARANGGVAEGESFEIAAAFDITRPARLVRFAHPVEVAGFVFREIPVRMADFGGRETFPVPGAQPGEIVVRRHIATQAAWPMVLIGHDRLDRCAEIVLDLVSKHLTLRCAFGD